MTHSFTVSAVVPAKPQEVYDAWLNGRSHAQMTGAQKATASARVGAKFTAWNGYIHGRNVALVPGRKIVQTWRTTEFTDADEDSEITVTLAKTARGARVTLRHSNVPDSHQGYKSGWGDHYFAPMKAYFGAMAFEHKAKTAISKSKTAKPAKRGAKKK